MASHENVPGVYVPATEISYPENPDQPILFPKKVRTVVLDENYPYLDKSFPARLRHFLVYLGIFVLVFPLQKLRYGLKIEGVGKHQEEQGFVPMFPESCRWDFYQPIRPFKKGAFTMAIRYQIPVLPLVISYREATGFQKLIGTKHLITIHIGEPLVPPPELSRKEATVWLRDEAHK